MAKQLVGFSQRSQHGFRHAIVEQRPQDGLRRRGRHGGAFVHVKSHAAFDAVHCLEPAMPGDIRRLGGPRRNRADTRHHQKQIAGGRHVALWSVGQQAVEHLPFVICQFPGKFGKVPIAGGKAGAR